MVKDTTARYVRVLLTGVGIGGLFVALAAGAAAVDRVLSRRSADRLEPAA